MYKIPLTNSPNQTFNFTVPVDEINYNFIMQLSYNEVARYWQMSLQKQGDTDYLFVNLPLLSSMYLYANMIYQLKYMKIGGIYIVPVVETNISRPNDEDLGTGYVLVWFDNEMGAYDE